MTTNSKLFWGLVVFWLLLAVGIGAAVASTNCVLEKGEDRATAQRYSATVNDYGNRWEAFYWVGNVVFAMKSPVLTIQDSYENVLFGDAKGKQFTMGIDDLKGMYGIRVYGLPDESVFIQCN